MVTTPFWSPGNVANQNIPHAMEDPKTEELPHPPTPRQMVIIPKLFTDKAVLHSEQGPAKCLCVAWRRVQFSITLLSDSKSLEKLQLRAASTEAGPRESTNHGFNHRESVKSDFVRLSLDRRKPSLCEEQNQFLPSWATVPRQGSQLLLHSPIPKAAYVRASTAKLQPLGWGAKRNFSQAAMDTASLPRLKPRLSNQAWEEALFTQK